MELHTIQDNKKLLLAITIEIISISTTLTRKTYSFILFQLSVKFMC